MSSGARRRAAGGCAARRRAARLRQLRIVVVALLLAGVIVGVALTGHGGDEPRLPLQDQSIIRGQAAEKHIDPALIAAVIYAETKFVPRESSAGAEGLMQILPSTAEFLAKLSGGYAFTTSDLGTPSVNIAYGSYYLRYLLNHYDGDKLSAVAAYNAGLTNVDDWVAKARSEGHRLRVSEIPFPETRAYVQKVLRAEVSYRRSYPRQLGLEQLP